MVEKKNNNFYVSIAGVMGSGKTTIARLIAKELGFHLLEENFQANIYLPRYYENPKEWAFHSQLFYLREKTSQLLRLRDLLAFQNVVQDTPIYQDVFTYAKAQTVLGYMNESEHALYHKFFDLFHDELPKPNLIIQLDAGIPTLEERIKRRGRDFEKAVDRDYLILLTKLQEEWINKNAQLKIIRLKTDEKENDFVNNENYRAKLMGEIKSALKGGSEV